MRRANIGASTVFISVSPVLPSLPAMTDAVRARPVPESAGSVGAERRREVDVREARGRARRRRTASWPAAGPASRRRARAEDVPATGVFGPRLDGGSVEATLTTTTWSSWCRVAKVRAGRPGSGRWRSRGVSAARQVGPVGEAGDRRRRVEHGAGADVRGPAVEVRRARLDDGRVEDVRAARAARATLCEQAAAADVVAADDELAGVVEVEAGEQRQAR